MQSRTANRTAASKADYGKTSACSLLTEVIYFRDLRVDHLCNLYEVN